MQQLVSKQRCGDPQVPKRARYANCDPETTYDKKWSQMCSCAHSSGLIWFEDSVVAIGTSIVQWKQTPQAKNESNCHSTQKCFEKKPVRQWPGRHWQQANGWWHSYVATVSYRTLRKIPDHWATAQQNLRPKCNHNIYVITPSQTSKERHVVVSLVSQPKVSWKPFR